MLCIFLCLQWQSQYLLESVAGCGAWVPGVNLLASMHGFAVSILLVIEHTGEAFGAVTEHQRPLDQSRHFSAFSPGEP